MGFKAGFVFYVKVYGFNESCNFQQQQTNLVFSILFRGIENQDTFESLTVQKIICSWWLANTDEQQPRGSSQLEYGGCRYHTAALCVGGFY